MQELRKKIMVIGLPESGKTAITNWIEGDKRSDRHRQDPTYRAQTIEAPGMYLENAWMRRIIVMMVQNQAKGLMMLVDATTGASQYNPRYAQLFNVPVIGIVTKLDQVEESKRDEAYKRGRELLETAGATCIARFASDMEDDKEIIIQWIEALR